VDLGITLPLLVCVVYWQVERASLLFQCSAEVEIHLYVVVENVLLSRDLPLLYLLCVLHHGNKSICTNNGQFYTKYVFLYR
jgi:hypothetical protein